ncbi:hypothetical protein ZWY2020_044848 [Hordeum vulgare]|nr:hypothetical protein ZWY2020_044848 [Hordeum vulgare]
MARTGRSVLLLLLLLIPTALSLLLLYERRLAVALNPIQRKDLPARIASQGRSVEDSKLTAFPLETASSLKEPVGAVLLDLEEPLKFAKHSIEPTDQELLPGKKANRVLSEITSGDGAVLKGGELIDQVTGRKAQDGGLATGSMDQQEKHTESQQQSSSEGRSLEGGKNPQKENTDGRSRNMPLSDTRVRDIRDQLIKAKVYLGLGAIRANPQYLRDLRQRIREVQKVLGDASKDSDLPKNANEKVKALEQTLVKGKQTQDDCSVAVKKLRAMLHSAEEQLHAQKKQTVFLTQLAAKTLPKGLHCLPLRLANEYFSLDPSQQQFPNHEKLDDPKLYHYALFSDNILATAVVVNSTVLNAKNEDGLLWKLGTLPPGLVTFWNKTFPLDRSWHVLGLGYNPHVSSRDLERAAVIHYNGNLKPWLEIGLPKFRSYWSKYLDYDQPFLRECNINP